MQCHVCGTGVRPEQKFCMECGARLQHQRAGELALAPPELGPGRDREAAQPTLALPPVSGGHPMFDPATGQLLVTSLPAPAGPDEDATNVLPALGEPVNTLGGATFAPPDPYAQGPGHWGRETVDAYPVWPGEQSGPARGGYDERSAPTRQQPTRQQYVNQPPYRSDRGSEQYGDPRGATGHVPATYVPWEGGAEPVAYGPTFRIRPLLLLAILAAVAAVVAMFVGVIDIEPEGPLPLGASKLNDFATNHTVTGILLSVTMVVGALAWCGGFRWGAGLAGGGGAGLAGWVVIVVGQVEVRITQAEALAPSAAVTRDIGYWCLVGAGGLGLLVLFASLLRAGHDGRAGLDPWVAALGAMATIAAVLGPLIPLNDANLDQNWSSPPGTNVPTLIFVARFVQLGLLLLCGVFGFLLVRRYGLGLAIGGAIGVGWMTFTTTTAQTDSPIGPAIVNPGSTDGKPYIVTVVGIGLMLFFGLVATAMALIDAD